MKENIDIQRRVIEKCLEGDIKAQYQLYSQYSKAMYNIAIRLLDNKMDAEDILQESFTKAFLHMGELSNPQAFGGWLKRIVINACISLQRKRKYLFDDVEDLQIEDESQQETMIGESTDPARIHAAIRELPGGCRTILVLHALEGMKHREVAESLDISESTSKTQYHRALKMMKEKLQAHEN